MTEQTAAPSMPTPIRMPATATLDFQSSVNGRDYRLLITPPPGPVPPEGWPVLCVLDGSGYHGTAVDMIRNIGSIGGEITPALVLAVTYPTDDLAQLLSRRSLDLTPTPGDDQHMLHDAPGHAFGGLERFLDTLEADVLPRLRTCFRINPAQMALVGHSLGGLTTLYALFTRTRLFQSYIAMCPSIWWDSCVLLTHEAGFAEGVRAGRFTPRVFVAMGGTEQDPPRFVPPNVPPEVLARGAALTQRSRMVDNARELYERLKALPGGPGYEVHYACLPGETHMTAPFLTLGHALAMAFPSTRPTQA
jgi:predicted alpha/beta superfamily hydrolase